MVICHKDVIADVEPFPGPDKIANSIPPELTTHYTIDTVIMVEQNI